MAEGNRWSTRTLDLSKAAVLLVLVLLVGIAFVASSDATPRLQDPSLRGAAEIRPSPPVGAAPVWDLAQTAAGGSVSLSGRAEPGSTVELWAGTIRLVAVPVDTDGNWSYAGQLEPGDYAIVARTVSAEGRVLNESEAVVLHVARATPEASTAVKIESHEVEPGGGISLSGRAEPGLTVELWAGEIKLAAIPVDAAGTWSYAGQLEPGDYAIVARTVSAEGRVVNESEAAAVSVSVARAVPVTANKPQVDASGAVIVSGTGEPGSTVDVLDNGVVVASAAVDEEGAWTVRYVAAAGEHTLAVQVQGQPGEGSAVGRVVVTGPASAGGQSYVVKHGDWLMKLARRYYGDARRWTDIYEATNAKAALDRSYHRITNPNLLSPGWKIWIPEP